MANKVRPGMLGAGDERPAQGPALFMSTLGSAAIRDDAQPLRSKRYLATIQLGADGWILHDNATVSRHGPFAGPEAAFGWWLDHRRALPPGIREVVRPESWPPGIDEDRAENDE
ncbi:hypothetical protein [Clavibacter sp. VKM Ac-2872]|uniref:hypothetical protein n=1 Tax=Clavibacter sp. VKM Ac-2872 TaxID=2783812 RepID=UPI00188C948D|nr:hypothetical protein [Clavibacter sp. VKM Ac-2872]MBF4625561.1 hypothetical protein [Clavibacter sp. VKM Ac-2872]